MVSVGAKDARLRSIQGKSLPADHKFSHRRGRFPGDDKTREQNLLFNPSATLAWPFSRTLSLDLGARGAGRENSNLWTPENRVGCQSDNAACASSSRNLFVRGVADEGASRSRSLFADVIGTLKVVQWIKIDT